MYQLTESQLGLTFSERMKRFELKHVAMSDEPHKLYWRHNGVFCRSFADPNALHRYVMGFSIEALTPKKPRRARR